jgi:hypothetical protein
VSTPDRLRVTTEGVLTVGPPNYLQWSLVP